MTKSNVLAISLRAIRQNLIPGIFLQLLSVAIIISYYYSPSIKIIWDKIALFKTEGGVLLAAISTGIFGGVIPLFIQQISKKYRQKNAWIHLSFYFLFWAYKGIEVDFLYKTQALLFGHNNQILTIVCKVFVDEFIYVPTLSCIPIVIGYAWKNNQYKLKGTIESLGKNWYREKIFPMIVSSWFIWIPTVSIIYCLPLGLQLPVQNLILCFWSLIVIFLTSKPMEQLNLKNKQNILLVFSYWHLFVCIRNEHERTQLFQ